MVIGSFSCFSKQTFVWISHNWLLQTIRITTLLSEMLLTGIFGFSPLDLLWKTSSWIATFEKVTVPLRTSIRHNPWIPNKQSSVKFGVMRNSTFELNSAIVRFLIKTAQENNLWNYLLSIFNVNACIFYSWRFLLYSDPLQNFITNLIGTRLD